jgi:para-nitrobenzyl esterase
MWTPVVETTSGPVRGLIKEGVPDFRGVRFGASTAGAGRFKPPRSPDPSPDVHDATEWGPRCPQKLFGDMTPPGGGRFPPRDLVIEGDAPMSEDCLFLNISTTGLDADKKRPVMVWLHGGGFSQGTSSIELMSGVNLARNGDGVVVTINHRLGLFGHLFLGEIGGEEYAASGNAGLLDIVLGLQWVRDNIARFGGDPANVTLFGQSGGNLKIACVLAMPAAKGLVHKAILQSVGRWVFPTRKQQSRRVSAILDQLGISADTLSGLHDLPAAAFVDLPGVLATGGADLGPVIDNVTLFDQPHDMKASGSWPDIPTILGFTADEAMIFPDIGGDPEFERLTEVDVRQRVETLIGHKADECLSLYEEVYPEYGFGYLWARICTDWMYFANWAAPIADRISTHSASPLYTYILDWRSPGFGGFYGAAHCCDIPFVFANTAEDPVLAGNSAEARHLGDVMSLAWMRFARSGDPNHDNLPTWPVYTPENREWMCFSAESHVEADPKRRERAFWSSITLPPMSGEYQ